MFTNTQYFSEAANHKRKYGVYCGAPKGSREYLQYWEEQDKRCMYGYSVAGVRVTGYHYFHLNFKQLEIVEDIRSKASRKKTDFPRFWAESYRFYHELERAVGNFDYTEHLPSWQEVHPGGKHLVIVKPRGTGFSEMMSSVGVCDYTLRKKSNSFYYAANEPFLLKNDGVLNKCWDHLDFLNSETEDWYLQIRQEADTRLHKKASRSINGKKYGSKSQIVGIVVDKPSKVRGARGAKLFFEEGGSFAGLKAAVRAAIPLVEQGGIVTGTIIIWGTGGEEGPGIEGLDDIFNHPKSFNMLEFEDEWTEGYTGTCGYFFPVHHCMDLYMDGDGNPLIEDALKAVDAKREEIKKSGSSSKDLDQHIAEYPKNPQEALMRMKFNNFPIKDLMDQRNRILSNPELLNFKLNGSMIFDENKRPTFQIDPTLKEIVDYPHESKGNLDGCITIYEKPLTYNGQVMPGMYFAVNDSYYKDEVNNVVSLAVTYIIKRQNNISSTEDDIIVAKYIGRPRRKETYFKQMFMLIDYYGCTLQAEIAGGGEAIKDFAQREKYLHLCEKEPDIIFNKERKSSNRGYFMNMDKNRKEVGLEYFIDWLLKERSISESGKIIMNLNKVYDLGLLSECIRFNRDGNFDRISAMIVAMYQMKEMHEIEVGARNNNRSNFLSGGTYTNTIDGGFRKLSNSMKIMKNDIM